jgi:hypothetical protein
VRRISGNTIEGTTRSIRNIYWQEWKSIVKRTLKGLLQTEVIGIMVSNDIELRMIAAQITMKASVGAEDLCSRYSSVSRMLGNMFNDVYYILQDVRYRYKYK